MPNTEPPEGYLRCVLAMQEAARQWIKQHPFAELRFVPDFEAQVARDAGKPPGECAIIAALCDVIDRWGANADTRAFLRELDRASDYKATYMQARALVDAAREEAIKRSSGQLPAGHWGCVDCGTRLDGFTNLDGDSAPPPPGAITVCAECGTALMVAASGDRYESCSQRELNQLPTSARKQLMTMRNAIRSQRERAKARN